MNSIDINLLLDNEGNIDKLVLKEILLELNKGVNSNILNNFVGTFKVIKVLATVTDYKIKHNLRYVPKDVIVMSVIPSNTTYSFTYEKFDKNNIVLSTDRACEIRALIGTYK